MTDRPAVLGGQPLFDPPISVFKPTLPTYEDVHLQVEELFETGMLTTGHFHRDFEAAVAAHLGVRHVVAVSSCTIGLMVACQSLDLQGEVIVPSFTFMATAHALAWNGLTPVFVDIDPDTWNIDPVAVDEAITDRTSAIMAVHLLGTPADVDALQAVAGRHGLKLIYDAAHGFGTLRNGEPVGRYGNVEVFSATPTKVLVAVEGGLVATNDEVIAERVRTARNYGNPGNYDSLFAGLNARMPEFNAIIGLESLRMLGANVERRNKIATTYHREIGRHPGIVFQRVEPSDRCSCKELSLLVKRDEFGLDRDQVAAALKAEGIDSRFYYDPPVHTHTAYAHLPRRDLPITDRVARETITIPLYSHMDDSTVERICEAFNRAREHAGEIRRIQSS